MKKRLKTLMLLIVAGYVLNVVANLVGGAQHKSAQYNPTPETKDRFRTELVQSGIKPNLADSIINSGVDAVNKTPTEKISEIFGTQSIENADEMKQYFEENPDKKKLLAEHTVDLIHQTVTLPMFIDQNTKLVNVIFAEERSAIEYTYHIVGLESSLDQMNGDYDELASYTRSKNPDGTCKGMSTLIRAGFVVSRIYRRELGEMLFSIRDSYQSCKQEGFLSDN